MSKLRSGFAKFASVGTRDSFVKAVLNEDATLAQHAFVPATRPTIVFEQLTDAEQARVRAALSGQGQWFDDTQFASTR